MEVVVCVCPCPSLVGFPHPRNMPTYPLNKRRAGRGERGAGAGGAVAGDHAAPAAAGAFVFVFLGVVGLCE